MGLDTNLFWVRDFIDEFYDLSTNKECISPVGSYCENHRQDQVLLTILYYKYKEKYNQKENIGQGILYDT